MCALVVDYWYLPILCGLKWRVSSNSFHNTDCTTHSKSRLLPEETYKHEPLLLRDTAGIIDTLDIIHLSEEKPFNL